MKRTVPISVALAAITVVCAGTALANNAQTINTSQGYADPVITAAFVPAFLLDHCSSASGATNGNCSDWGARAVANAAGVTTVLPDGEIVSGNGYFGNAAMIPVLDQDTWNLGIQHAAWNNTAPFSSGLMSWDRSDGTSYFAGLNLAWTGYADAANSRGEIPMGIPQLGGSESVREEWVDQTVVTYVESFDAAKQTNLEQNFRSQLSWIGTILPGLAETYAHIDQRLEQDLTLDDAGLAFSASRQTMQSAFAVNSNTGATADPWGDGSGGSGLSGALASNPAGYADTSGLGQLVTQDVQGWFYSCLNCNSSRNQVSNTFTPFETKMAFMPYTNTWRDLPSIGHTASDGNVTLYASAPAMTAP